MSLRYFFVGEAPSPKALAMGVTWKDGRLAAKQLFDALTKCGIDPQTQLYDNLFAQVDEAAFVCVLNQCGVQVVAMGERVSKRLREVGVPHLKIVHPAARGKIRRKDRYITHIQERLGCYKK